jgi:hypothetical protein
MDTFTFVQVLERFFQVGEEKAGMMNLVVARLCKLWSRSDGGSALAVQMTNTIVDACMFGTIHKKTERWVVDLSNSLQDFNFKTLLASKCRRILIVHLGD